METEHINGKSIVLGVIGDPISHSFSPQIHNTLAAMTSNNIVYVPFQVKNEKLQEGIKGAHALGIQGLNVTVPHKQAVIPYLSGIDPLAEKIGAVNTLKYHNNGYLGYNTDIIGILKTFQSNDFALSGISVLIIGAGGSAYACALAMAESGVDKIIIANRTLDNAKTLAEKIKKNYNVSVEVISLNDIGKTRADIIVQTTSGGLLGGSALEVCDANIFQKARFVLDIIYSPWETPFLALAKKYCPICVNGFQMLVYQAIAAFEIFTDTEVDSNISRALFFELEKYIETAVKSTAML